MTDKCKPTSAENRQQRDLDDAADRQCTNFRLQDGDWQVERQAMGER